jgi:hypothetical protein
MVVKQKIRRRAAPAPDFAGAENNVKYAEKSNPIWRNF